LKIAVSITIIGGITASLVKRPRIIRIEQKNSANIARARDELVPIPKKLRNCSFRSWK
jgi:hypothetical protein